MFDHQRHKPPTDLVGARELIVALPPLRSQVNAARILRAAGCCGVRRMIICGRTKIDPKIAREATQQIDVQRPRSLAPALKRLRADRYQLVGIEQTTNSQCVHNFQFVPRTVLVVGHERLGLTPELLALMDHVVEIPVYGIPHSYNVATAAAMVLYEFCRQQALRG